MKQKVLNVTFSRDVHKRNENEIGVLTFCRIEEERPGGKNKLKSQRCSYEILKNPVNIPVNKKKNMRIITTNRRVA